MSTPGETSDWGVIVALIDWDITWRRETGHKSLEMMKLTKAALRSRQGWMRGARLVAHPLAGAAGGGLLLGGGGGGGRRGCALLLGLLRRGVDDAAGDGLLRGGVGLRRG